MTYGERVNTSFVERDNLTQQQQNRRLKCGCLGLLPFERASCQLADICYRYPNPRGIGSLRRWRLVTPAMATGIIDYVWITRELLSYRVSPLDWQNRPIPEKLFLNWPEGSITETEEHYQIL
jgi:hypothetical protein